MSRAHREIMHLGTARKRLGTCCGTTSAARSTGAIARMPANSSWRYGISCPATQRPRSARVMPEPIRAVWRWFMQALSNSAAQHSPGMVPHRRGRSPSLAYAMPAVPAQPASFNAQRPRGLDWSGSQRACVPGKDFDVRQAQNIIL